MSRGSGGSIFSRERDENGLSVIGMGDRDGLPIAQRMTRHARLPIARNVISQAHVHQRRAGAEVKPEDVVRLSPLSHEHINVLGRYPFALADNIAEGELRPLHQPNDHGDPAAEVTASNRWPSARTETST